MRPPIMAAGTTPSRFNHRHQQCRHCHVDLSTVVETAARDVVEDTMNRKVVVAVVEGVEVDGAVHQANNMMGVAEAQVGEVEDRMIGEEEGVTIGEADEEVDTATKSLVAGYKRGNRR